MTSIDDIKRYLEDSLSPKRYIHSLNVMNTAVELGANYNADTQMCLAAGLLHDCARNVKGEKLFLLCNKYGLKIDNVAKVQPELLHGPLGAKIAKQVFDVQNEDILNAISYHTTGREGMSILEKIVFIADYIEPGRKHPGVDDVRKLAYIDIDKAILLSLEDTIKYVLSKGQLLHILTVAARNYLILEKKKC